jgi:hypothetical protein
MDKPRLVIPKKKEKKIEKKKGRPLLDFLHDKEIDTLITEGIEERLADPESKNWQPTVDFIAKVRGDFAPEKQITATISAEDKDQEYKKIAELIKDPTPKGSEEA